MNHLSVRPYTITDYPGLLALQKEAFPPPFPEELWWKKTQIQAHIDSFPEGALAAELNGIIVGSATSLLTTYTGQPHTWDEISDNGYIKASHEIQGDSLYGIDVCVHPRYRGLGIAQALYDARKRLVTQQKLKRFIAGCRIPNYHIYQKQMTVEQYIERVVHFEIKDDVLSFMLKQGLQPLQILPNYLEDEESCHYGILVEWKPEFESHF
ncbi:GNAT family N-acetyltransferase [Alkalihalobacillus trypoxylicola]|uniref:Acetyltransferase n=1 Tax=Alkalihalobacillus trypoxylicola TaxID=519424 RepID=A0A161PAV0_9BACI|nr:GNAT family N-acetyltransferase [Alkalihalobacillus trypoxylicola]KYG29292.1 acetyltransferase [Alkalihalobacillus trypoxylicola]